MSDQGRQGDVIKGMENLKKGMHEKGVDVTKPRSGRTGFRESKKEQPVQNYEGSEFSIKVDGIELSINTQEGRLIDSYADLYAFAGLNQQSEEPVGLQKYIEEAELEKKGLESWEEFRKAFGKVRDLLGRVPDARKKGGLEELDDELEKVVTESLAPAAKAIIEEIHEQGGEHAPEQESEERTVEQMSQDIITRLKGAGITRKEIEQFTKENIHPVVVAARDAKDPAQKAEHVGALKEIAEHIEHIPPDALAREVRAQISGDTKPPAEEGVGGRERLERAQVSLDTPEQPSDEGNKNDVRVSVSDLPRTDNSAQSTETTQGEAITSSQMRGVSAEQGTEAPNTLEEASEETTKEPQTVYSLETNDVSGEFMETQKVDADTVTFEKGETPWESFARYVKERYPGKTKKEVDKALNEFFRALKTDKEMREGMNIDERFAPQGEQGEVKITKAAKDLLGRAFAGEGIASTAEVPKTESVPAESPESRDVEGAEESPSGEASGEIEAESVSAHDSESGVVSVASVADAHEETATENVTTETEAERDAREREELLNESGGMREVYEEVKTTMQRDLRRIIPGTFWRRSSGMDSSVWKKVGRQNITEFMEGGGGEVYDAIRAWLREIHQRSGVSPNQYRGNTVEAYARSAMEQAIIKEKRGGTTPRRPVSQIRGFARRMQNGPKVPDIS